LFIGVPALISSKGVEKIIEIALTDDEKAMLETTKSAVQKTIGECQEQGF